MAGVANASIIGIFGEEGAITCSKVWNAPYAQLSVYFCALLDDIDSMSACEFGATGVSQGATGALAATAVWNTPLVIGNIMLPDGVALAFPEPLLPPLAYLGRIDYVGGLTPPPADFVMQVVPSGAGNLVVVDAGTATTYPAQGWRLIVNCTIGGAHGNCGCEDTIATEDANWGQIKALY
jgi:hypothetical protein